MRAYALVPARAGSKGVPGKNVRPLAGFPLIAYSIAAARLCSELEQVIVSTDSPEIAAIARSFGAETPFLRPVELAQDSSSDLDFIRHTLEWLREHDGSVPEALALLRPTTPLRDPELVGAALRSLDGDPEATSLRAAHQLAEPPQKMLGIEGGYLVGLFPDDPRPEYYNLPRQTFPPAYQPNGYVDVVRAEVVLGASQQLFGPRVRAFVTPFAVEVDRPDDFDYLEYLVERSGHPLLDYLNGS